MRFQLKEEEWQKILNENLFKQVIKREESNKFNEH